MKVLKFRNLTDDQRAEICNGCGAMGGWFQPPDYIFTASCDQHDFNYWLGGGDAERKKADLQFYQAMKRDANSAPWWKRWFYKGAAWRYYTAVRAFGKKAFYYGPTRTWEDIEA